MHWGQLHARHKRDIGCILRLIFGFLESMGCPVDAVEALIEDARFALDGVPQRTGSTVIPERFPVVWCVSNCRESLSLSLNPTIDSSPLF